MTPIRIHRMNLEVLSPHYGCCNPPVPPNPSACCNTIRVDMTATATLGVRLTNIPRPRVAFTARAVTMGRLSNA